MALVTEWFASHTVPRLTIGKADLDGTGINLDGYAYGMQVACGTDGYVIDLRLNSAYELTTQNQALWYAMLSRDEINAVEMANIDFSTNPIVPGRDDGYYLALLDAASAQPNGHLLLSNTMRVIGTTALCSKLVMKSATSTATVTIAPLGSFMDPPDNGRRVKR